jgi:hypothetical protein
MNDATNRTWQQILDRVDLEVRDGDLAAAERALRELPGDEVVQIRPEWLSATIATATAPAKPDPAPRFAAIRRFAARIQHAAAAVLALVGIHSATAATATAIAVGTVTTVAIVSALWPEGAFSYETMSYEQAVAILMDPTEPEQARQAAMFQVSLVVGSSLELFREIETTGGGAAMLAGEAATSRQELLEVLRGSSSRYYSSQAGSQRADALLAAAGDPSLEATQRAESLRELAASALAGASALRSMPGITMQLATDRDRILRKLLRLAATGD